MNRSQLGVISVALIGMMSATGAATTDSQSPTNPYSGQEKRSIKALPEQEIAGLLEGQGAGLAKAAELNGYPGPAHTVALASQLGLDDAQLSASQRLMTQHKARARQLGAALVDSERELDRLFAQKQAVPLAVENATRKIGTLQGQLRAEHLKIHLTQTELLTPAQVRRYNELRGYVQPRGATSALPVNPSPHDAGH